MLIPGVVSNLLLYIVAILVGALVTTGAIFFLKRPISAEAPAEQVEPRVAAVYSEVQKD
jgi:PTS system fructose-specific IIC component